MSPAVYLLKGFVSLLRIDTSQITILTCFWLKQSFIWLKRLQCSYSCARLLFSWIHFQIEKKKSISFPLLPFFFFFSSLQRNVFLLSGWIRRNMSGCTHAGGILKSVWYALHRINGPDSHTLHLTVTEFAIYMFLLTTPQMQTGCVTSKSVRQRTPLRHFIDYDWQITVFGEVIVLRCEHAKLILHPWCRSSVEIIARREIFSLHGARG